MTGFLNFSTRKVGGLRFVKIGRLTLSYSIARRHAPFRPLKGREPVEPAPMRHRVSFNWPRMAAGARGVPLRPSSLR